MEGHGRVGAEAEPAVEIPEVDAFGQGHAPLPFDVFADVVLDSVEHAVRVFALDDERVGFAHDGPW
ncbi:hypothetical protein D3C72_2500470 [compost metagenome]